MQLKCITTEGWGLRPSRQAIFVIFRQKIVFKAIWITFCTFLEPYEITKLLRFESHLKELNCPAPSAPFRTV